jgi:hypothetical protein
MNQFIVVKFPSSVMLTLRPSLLLYATNKLIPDPDAIHKVFEALAIVRMLTRERYPKLMVLVGGPLSNGARRAASTARLIWSKCAYNVLLKQSEAFAHVIGSKLSLRGMNGPDQVMLGSVSSI